MKTGLLVSNFTVIKNPVLTMFERIKMQTIKLKLVQYERYHEEVIGLIDSMSLIVTLSDENLNKLADMLRESFDFGLDFEKIES